MADRLLEAARSAAARAYARYSGYRVGAAVETHDGRVFTGCNVENASYGLTICAERAAVAAAVAAGFRRFRRIAIAARGGPPPYPCGACRQVLHEFGDDIEVWIASRTGATCVRLADLLPSAFRFRNNGRRGLRRPIKKGRRNP